MFREKTNLQQMVEILAKGSILKLNVTDDIYHLYRMDSHGIIERAYFDWTKTEKGIPETFKDFEEASEDIKNFLH